MKIEHQVVNLDHVLRYYADRFEAKDGKPKPTLLRAFVDTSERVVVFELYLENEVELEYRKTNII